MLLLIGHHKIWTLYAYPNYNAIPNTFEKGSPSLILGLFVWIVETPIVLASNNTMTKLAKFEKCNSKSAKQSDIVWIDEYYLPFEPCKRSNCLLLVNVASKLISKANHQYMCLFSSDGGKDLWLLPNIAYRRESVSKGRPDVVMEHIATAHSGRRCVYENNRRHGKMLIMTKLYRKDDYGIGDTIETAFV